MDATRADVDLRLAKLDELHNAYQNALGLKLQSEDGAPQQQGVGWHARASAGCWVPDVHGTSVVKCVCKMVFMWLLLAWPVFAGELFLEFTQISAEQPTKPYGFAVQVLEDEKYRGETWLVANQLAACAHEFTPQRTPLEVVVSAVP